MALVLGVSMPKPNNISWPLTLAGAIDGEVNASVDGSVTPQEFKIIPATYGFKSMKLERMLVQIEDNAVFTSAGYGGVGALANGIHIYHSADNGATETHIDALRPVKSAAHWARLCYDFSIHSFGSGNNFATIRWTFAKTGSPLCLGPGDELVVEINDDLTDLVDHSFIVQGTGAG